MSPSDPSPLAASKQIVGFLSVLAGAQRGARAPLSDDVDYVVGSDDGCDLVVWDDSVAPRHLVLACRAGHLRIGALDDAVALDDGILEAGESVERVPGLIVRLGAIYLGVGAECEDWSLAVWPRLTAAGPERGAETDDAADTGMLRESPAAEVLEIPTPDGDEAREEGQAAPRAFRLPVIVGWGIPLLLVLLPLLIVTPDRWRPGASWLREETVEQAAAISMGDPLEQARAVLERFSLTDIELAERADGMLTLTGYCDSRELKDRVTFALNAAGLRIDNRLWPDDRLRATLEQTLERLGAGLIEHEYLGRGEVRLRGHLPASLDREPFVRLLRHDVAGLAHIEDDEMHAVAELLEELRQRVRQAGLPLERLDLSAEGRVIRVSGRLNAADASRWDAVASAFEQAYPGLVFLEASISWSVRATAAAAGAPDWVPSRRVMGVLIGLHRIAFALLDNGVRVTVGDSIDGRYLIEEIHFDRVIAFDGGERRIFHVGVNAND